MISHNSCREAAGCRLTTQDSSAGCLTTAAAEWMVPDTVRPAAETDHLKAYREPASETAANPHNYLQKAAVRDLTTMNSSASSFPTATAKWTVPYVAARPAGKHHSLIPCFSDSHFREAMSYPLSISPSRWSSRGRAGLRDLRPSMRSTRHVPTNGHSGHCHGNVGPRRLDDAQKRIFQSLAKEELS